MNNEQAEILNDLIKHLYDSCKGYVECAEDVPSGKLKDLFLVFSRQRQQMIDEIKSELTKFNKSGSDRGTVAGALHRAFVNIKNLLRDNDIDSIVNEIKFGENFLIDAYKKALKSNLPSDTKKLLTMQLENIEDNLKKVDIESLRP